ncbi:MAG: cytochrome b/b6 domain-containing protein [Candidatus Eremiobacteraeota bacterium]|nr:cytochrome b/b6 domain-containing protein [Candidatus Eremiobacteraeota bacterium]
MNRVYRYPLSVRITHWLSALCLGVLAMSGMQIFNAHPALYASNTSNFSHPVLAMHGEADHGGGPLGYVKIGKHRINTTGALGWGPDGMGQQAERGFPSWATIPGPQDLADGRRWHIFFAWLFALCALIYARWAFALWPSAKDIRAVPAALKEHLVPWRILPTAEANPLQKLSYFIVVFAITPLVIVSGLALAPSVDAWAPWLPALLGGRQFARIWHFAGMLALMAFFVGHIAMVALTGMINNLRSMITGWYGLKETS